MKPRSLSVGAVLEHWVAAIAHHGHAKVSASPTSPQVVTMELVFPTLDHAYVSDADVATLREALEMLHLASLVDVTSVEDAVAGLCYHSFAEPEDDDDENDDRKASLDPALSASPLVAREVEFVLTFYGTPGRFLAETLAPSLFAVQGPRSDEFLSARRELLNGHNVPIKPLDCRVNIVSMDGAFDEDMEDDYIQRVVSFVRQLDEVVVSGEANQSDGVPIHVTSINLELNEMSITTKTVAAVTLLPTTAIPVLCNRVGINPSGVMCSAEELTTFLDCVGARSNKMTVEIGHVLLSEPTQCLDADGASQEQLFRTLFGGITRAVCVTGLSFGPLLAMIGSPANRRALWHELVARLTDVRTVAQVTSLILSPQVELVDEDAASIDEAIASTATPIQITTLIMWLNQSSPAAVQALVRSVGRSATSVTLHSESHAMTPTETVEAIVRDCPLLQKLSLTAAEIESMDLFASKPTPLQELSLTSVAVKDAHSTTNFFSSLANTTTVLAKNLRKLHIKTENNDATSLAIDETTATIVEQLLETNKVLHTLELSVSDVISTTTLAAIQAHDGETLAEPLMLAQKLAFLSTTQPHAGSTSDAYRSRVDEDVVRLVFAFAAERVTRRVYVDF